MDRTKKEERQQDSQKSKEPKKLRLELGRGKLLLCALGLTLSLSWMFVFGVVVGRGIPLVSLGDSSLRAEFLRFLGLGRQTPVPPENAAETWEPQKVLESLNYFEDLTQKNVSIGVPVKPSVTSPEAPPAPAGPSDASMKPVKDPNGVPPKKKAQPANQVAAEPEKSAATDSGPKGNAGEQFTLLVGSLKDRENAQKLMEQLRTKGYQPRLESLDLSGAGRWNRVLVGTFKNRDEAMRFAAEFNRKERMEGLIIRESQ
jgi:cell division septation protein DedD